MKGLLKLTWLELKIFAREPMGLIGTVLVPLIVFLVLGRQLAKVREGSPQVSGFLSTGLPVFVIVLIALSAVLSLIAILSIYREGGILRRLRATPLQPPTILLAHVLVKLVLTAMTLAGMMLLGRRILPEASELRVEMIAFVPAMLVAMIGILSMGFVLASAVPTARFAQPLASMVLYPMLPISGLFFPVERLGSPWSTFAEALPITRAVSLLAGVWSGAPLSAHLVDIGYLLALAAVCTALSARIFRWE